MAQSVIATGIQKHQLQAALSAPEKPPQKCNSNQLLQDGISLIHGKLMKVIITHYYKTWHLPYLQLMAWILAVMFLIQVTPYGYIRMAACSAQQLRAQAVSSVLTISPDFNPPTHYSSLFRAA